MILGSIPTGLKGLVSPPRRPDLHKDPLVSVRYEVPGVSHGHSFPSSKEAKKAWSYAPTPSIRLEGTVRGSLGFKYNYVRTSAANIGSSCVCFLTGSFYTHGRRHCLWITLCSPSRTSLYRTCVCVCV
jgi:hypothetical protein